MTYNKPGYILKIIKNSTFEIYNATGETLLIKNSGAPFLPVANRAVIWSEPKITTDKIDGVDIVTFNMDSNSLYQTPQVVLELRDDYIEYYFKATVKRRVALHKWYLLDKGSEINALECLDFRSHINSPAAYEVHQTILGRRKLGTIGLDANTEDSDLMFAPHPMLFVFRHLEDNLIIAPMQLIPAESLHVKMIKGTNIIDDFHVRIGDSLYWLEQDEQLESPHFMIVHSKTTDVYEALSKYTNLLVQDEHVKPKLETDIEPWWLSPMWCSWGDQHVQLDSDEVVHTAYTDEERWQAVNAINDRLINNVVDVIESHQLPIKTLIIDDRWYTWQGDMHVDTSKFPDFRGTIDNLHAKNFKVLAWASLYQFDKESIVYREHPEWFIIHHYPRNPKHPFKDIICLDYSDPEIAGQFLDELMTRLLSDKPGCYNLDGIKFDWPFMLPHDYAFSNRDWVGKEKTIYNTQKLIYNAAKKAKKDALIIGVSPHPFFNDTQDIIRTYDVSTFDPTIHLERARYIKSIAPGMIPAMDEHVFHQNFFRYIKEGSKLGIPMIYNLLRFNGDAHIYTEDDYKKLKILLDDYIENTPALKNTFTTR